MTPGTLDLLLVAAIALFAVSGYRQGFLVGVLSFGGFLGGGVLGTLLAPGIAERFADGPARALLGVGVVLVLATLGQLAGTTLGATLRRQVTWRPARLLDAGGGAAVSAAGVLLVAWLLGTAAAETPYQDLNRSVQGSRVLRVVDDLMPAPPKVFAAFRDLLDRQGFPRVFDGLGPRSTVNVPPPDPKVLASTAVRRARDRVVKVVGEAPSCSRRLTGSGFVYADKHVMTNAHVVAGVRDPRVEVPGKGALPARVVLFDPKRDVAVLYVPDLEAKPLAFVPTAARGASAVVAGYPEDGPFNVVAARVREELVAEGRDIYDRSSVRREIYGIRARVRPGNSGGPLLAADGRVYGVIFAAAADGTETGYALTADEVAADARAGATRTERVGTGPCD